MGRINKLAMHTDPLCQIFSKIVLMAKLLQNNSNLNDFEFGKENWKKATKCFEDQTNAIGGKPSELSFFKDPEKKTSFCIKSISLETFSFKLEFMLKTCQGIICTQSAIFFIKHIGRNCQFFPKQGLFSLQELKAIYYTVVVHNFNLQGKTTVDEDNKSV